ncbi:MAG: hypothetical protein AAGA77_07330 [Bacteroidota bacterium]
MMDYSSKKVHIGFLLLCFILINCKSPQPVEAEQNKEFSSQKSDNLADIKVNGKNDSARVSDTLIKMINGEEVKFKYDLNAKRDIDGNRLLWYKEYKDHEDLLTVKLINDNTILYSDYLTEKRYDQFQNRYYNFDLVIPETLEFYDNRKKLVKTIKIRESNPFLKDSKGDKRVTEFFYNMGEYYVYRITKSSIKDEEIQEKWIYSNVEAVGPYTIVNYSLESVNDNLQIIKIEHFITILDSLGNEVFQLNSDHAAISNTISSDGKYFALIYDIEKLTNDNSTNQDSGLEIWNTSSQYKIFESAPKGQFEFVDGITSVLDENIIKFTLVNDHPSNKSTTWILFDCDKSTLYTRNFSNNQLDRISLDWFDKYKSYRRLMKEYPFTPKKI